MKGIPIGYTSMRSTLMRYTHEVRTHEVYAHGVSPRKMFRLRQVLILALDFGSGLLTNLGQLSIL